MQMTICVVASFTVCTLLDVDLARIPRPFFPGVVFCFGLGNMYVCHIPVCASSLTSLQFPFDQCRS